MLILYLSRINNSGPSKAKNQQFLSNKTESTNCVDQSLVGSFQDLQMIALWKLSLRRRQSSISPSFLLSFLSLLEIGHFHSLKFSCQLTMGIPSESTFCVVEYRVAARGGGGSWGTGER